MPFSIVHLEIGTSLKNYFHTEDNFLDFLAGSIFVDSAYNLSELGVKINREITHYYENESFSSSDFPKNFYDTDLTIGFSYFKLGYYYHLILDKLWRDSDFVGDCYKNIDKENLYQLSRIVYAKYDFDAYIKAFGLNIIDKMYDYKVDKNIIPRVYSNIDSNHLQVTYISILEYMCGKKYFRKIEGENIIYKIINGEIKIINKYIENDMKKYFPYEKYLELKNEGLDILKRNIIKQKTRD